MFSIIPVSDFFIDQSYENIKNQKREKKEKDLITLLKRSFDIYRDHSLVKFNQESDLNSFLDSFYTQAVESFQSFYTVDNKIVGVGYLDLSQNGVSSVYFAYDPEYSHLGLGGHSVIREIKWTVERGLPYYYLGYYIPECSRMAYKGRYVPYEIYDWEKNIWENPLIASDNILK